VKIISKVDIKTFNIKEDKNKDKIKDYNNIKLKELILKVKIILIVSGVQDY